MSNAKTWAFIAAVLICLPLQGNGEEPRTRVPTVSPAVEGILAAFDRHPLVGIGDDHNLAQELDFFTVLIRDPRFAQRVGNVVVEFGGAARQDTINAYVAGEPVPYAELRKVWTDVVGWLPTVTGLGYLNFYAQVRAVNRTLPANERIHVWLGEPEIDWSKIKTKEDWMRIAGFRDAHAAEVIERDILAQNKKALVIYGTQHFGPPLESVLRLTREKQAMDKRLGFDTPLQLGLQTLVEQSNPGSFFVVSPYSGFLNAECSDKFEQSKRPWPRPALAMPVRNSTLERELKAAGCYFVAAPSSSASSESRDGDAQQLADNTNANLAGLTSDALLYLGPANSLTRTPINPDLYLDLDYRNEVSHHSEVLTGQPLGPPKPEDMSASPHPWH